MSDPGAPSVGAVRRPGPLVRAAVAVGSVLGGMLGGAATTLVHSLWWGLVLGVAAAVATLAALPPRLSARLAFALAWAATVYLLAQARPEGDYLVGQDVLGYALLAIAMVLALGSAVTLERPRRAVGADPAEADPARPAP